MSVPTKRPQQKFIQQPINSLSDFKNALYQILMKFGENFTLQYAQDEIKELIAEHITDSERMNAFLQMISDINDQQKLTQKKEQIKLFGLVGEFFCEKMIPFMPKIVLFYQKKFKDLDPQLFQTFSDSLGMLYHSVLKNIANKEDCLDQLKIILREIHQSIITNQMKSSQVVASMCLAKIIQNSPQQGIKKILPKLSNRLLEQIQNPLVKCRAQIFECLISIVLSIEKDFQPYTQQFLPFLLEGIQQKDLETKKMAIDVVYTIGAILPQSLSPYKDHFLENLNESRFDKQKPIREAAIEAIQILKDLAPTKQKKVNRTEGQEKGRAREDPTPRPKEMPQEKYEIQAEKKGQGSPNVNVQQRQVTAVTQKKLMNARIMKSKSPVRKEHQKIDKEQKQSIFKGPVNQEFFKKVENLENGIEIVIKQGQDEEEEKDEEEQDEQNQMDTIEYQEQEQFEQNQELEEEQKKYFMQEERPEFMRKQSDLYKETLKQQNFIQQLSPIKENFEFEQAQDRYSQIMRNQFYEQQQDEVEHEQVENINYNNGLNYILYELTKISNQNMRIMESMSSFQNFTRNEIDYLKGKLFSLENSYEEL